MPHSFFAVRGIPEARGPGLSPGKIAQQSLSPAGHGAELDWRHSGTLERKIRRKGRGLERWYNVDIFDRERTIREGAARSEHDRFLRVRNELSLRGLAFDPQRFVSVVEGRPTVASPLSSSSGGNDSPTVWSVAGSASRLSRLHGCYGPRPTACNIPLCMTFSSPIHVAKRRLGRACSGLRPRA